MAECRVPLASRNVDSRSVPKPSADAVANGQALMVTRSGADHVGVMAAGSEEGDRTSNVLTPRMSSTSTLAAGDPIPANCELIEVHVSELKQLFNAIDPSPFRE